MSNVKNRLYRGLSKIKELLVMTVLMAGSAGGYSIMSKYYQDIFSVSYRNGTLDFEKAYDGISYEKDSEGPWKETTKALPGDIGMKEIFETMCTFTRDYVKSIRITHSEDSTIYRLDIGDYDTLTLPGIVGCAEYTINKDGIIVNIRDESILWGGGYF